MRLKKSMLGASCSLFLAATALADGPTSTVNSGGSIYNWSGVYVGAIAGANIVGSNAKADFLGSQSGGTFSSTGELDASYASAGARFAVLRQFNGLIVGFQGSFEGVPGGSISSNLRCSDVTPGSACNQYTAGSGANTGGVNLLATQSIKWHSNALFRLGMPVSDQFAVSFLAGAAAAQIRSNGVISTTDTNTGSSFNSSFSDTQIRAGWAVGASIEAVVARNWVVGLEFLHEDFGRVTSEGSLGQTCNSCGPGGFPLNVQLSSSLVNESVKATISYKFD